MSSDDPVTQALAEHVRREPIASWLHLAAATSAPAPPSPSPPGYRARRQTWERDGEDIPIAALVERDGGVCWLCRTQVDPEAAFPDRASPTRDHLIRFVDGGTHTWDNVRLAHLGCNVDRQRDQERRR